MDIHNGYTTETEVTKKNQDSQFSKEEFKELHV